MAIRLECPSCDAAVRVPDADEGKKVSCPECDHRFVARNQGIATRPAAPSRAPARRAERASEPEKSGGGMVLALVLGGGAAVVLMLALGGVGLWLLLRPAKASPPQVAATIPTPPAAPAAPPVVQLPQGGQPPPVGPGPVGPGPVVPGPVVPGPGAPVRPIERPPVVTRPPVVEPPKPAPPGGGKQYTPKNNRYTILMPPGVRTAQLTRIVRINRRAMPIEGSLVLLKDGTSFSASSIGVPAVVMREIPADERFNVFRDAIAKQLGGKVIAEEAIEQKGIAGKDYRIQGERSMARMRMYLIGGFVLFAVVEGKNADAVDSNVADVFYASFQLLDTK